MASGSSTPSKEMEDQLHCGGCKSLEEVIYWKHIKRLRFCVVLRSDFQDKLSIPKKFADNMRPNILNPKMTLKGPSGASWEVTLMSNVDGLFLQDGWEEFANAYSLQENDILFFKYDRSSSFDVKIFNGECEREAAYFVKKCGHASPAAVKDQRKRVSSEIVDENEGDGYGRVVCATTKKARVVAETEPVNCVQKGAGLKCYVRASKKIHSRRKPIQWALRLLRKRAASSSPKGKSSSPKGRQSLDSHTDQNGSTNKVVASTDQNPSEVTVNCSPNAAAFQMVLHQNGSTNKGAASTSTDQNRSEVTECCTPDAAAFQKVVLPQNGSAKKGVASTSADQNRSEVTECCTPNAAASADKNPSEVIKNCIPDAVAFQKAVNHQKTVGRPRNPYGSSKNKASSVVEYISNRRRVTAEERTAALRKAAAELSDNSFFAAMPNTACYKAFFMTIPVMFATTHFGYKNEDVILRVGEKKWLTAYNFSRGGLGPGWKQFALDNGLEESDACLFKFVTQANSPSLMLYVTIFRVVEEVTPPTLMGST